MATAADVVNTAVAPIAAIIIGVAAPAVITTNVTAKAPSARPVSKPPSPEKKDCLIRHCNEQLNFLSQIFSKGFFSLPYKTLASRVSPNCAGSPPVISVQITSVPAGIYDCAIVISVCEYDKLPKSQYYSLPPR